MNFPKLQRCLSVSAMPARWCLRVVVGRCMDVIRDLGTEIQRDESFGPLIMEDIEIMGVQRFVDSAVVIRARI